MYIKNYFKKYSATIKERLKYNFRESKRNGEGRIRGSQKWAEQKNSEKKK